MKKKQIKLSTVHDNLDRLNKFNDDLIAENQKLHAALSAQEYAKQDLGYKPQQGQVEIASAGAAKDNINHPSHYKSHPSGIECIEIVRHMNFNRGNAIKYIWRAGQKQDELHDLGKAIWYLKDEIERIKNAR